MNCIQGTVVAALRRGVAVLPEGLHPPRRATAAAHTAAASGPRGGIGWCREACPRHRPATSSCPSCSSSCPSSCPSSSPWASPLCVDTAATDPRISADRCRWSIQRSPLHSRPRRPPSPRDRASRSASTTTCSSSMHSPSTRNARGSPAQSSCTSTYTTLNGSSETVGRSPRRRRPTVPDRSNGPGTTLTSAEVIGSDHEHH